MSFLKRTWIKNIYKNPQTLSLVAASRVPAFVAEHRCCTKSVREVAAAMAINATRAVRKTDEYLKLIQSTNDEVAPGTYEASKKTGAIVLAEGEALAPFMSMQDLPAWDTLGSLWMMWMDRLELIVVTGTAKNWIMALPSARRGDQGEGEMLKIGKATVKGGINTPVSPSKLGASHGMFDFESLESPARKDDAVHDVSAKDPKDDSQEAQRWRAMGLDLELFRADLLLDLEALATRKPRELSAECRQLGIEAFSEKSELVQALRKVRLWQALPRETLLKLAPKGSVPVSPDTSHAQLLRILVSKHFATPAPASRFGNIFATGTKAQSGASPEPGRSKAPTAASGEGSKVGMVLPKSAEICR
eukprot:s2832_g7.t1